MLPRVTMRDLMEESELSSVLKVTAEKYNVSEMITLDRWKKMWAQTERRIQTNKAEATRAAATQIINDVSIFLTDIVTFNCALPKARLNNPATLVVAETQTAEMLCVIAALRHLFRKTRPSLSNLSERTKNPHAAYLAKAIAFLAQGPFYNFCHHVIAKWCEVRRDDVFGAAEDGGWPTPLVRSVFAIVCFSVKTWNKNACELETHPLQYLISQLKGMTMSEFGGRYKLYVDGKADPSRETSIMMLHCYNWLDLSRGTPLIPPKSQFQDLENRKIATIRLEHGEYPWQPSVVLQNSDYPWNRTIDAEEIHKLPKELTLSEVSKMVSELRKIQDNVSWNPLLEVYVNFVLFSRVCAYVLMPRKKREALEPDAVAYDTAKYSDKFQSFMVRNITVVRFELAYWNWIGASVLHWSFKSDCAFKGIVVMADEKIAFCRSENAHWCEKEANWLRLTRLESDQWTSTLIGILREIKKRSAYRDVLKEAVSAVSPGYMVWPGDIELHYRTASKIASRRPLDILNYFRPSEYRSLLNLIFSPYSLLHCVAYGSASMLKSKIVMDEMSSDPMESIDPLVPTQLKYAIYHKMYPCLHMQVDLMQRMAQQQANSVSIRRLGNFTMSFGTGNEKMLHVTDIGKEVIESVWNSVLDSSNTDSNSIAFSPENLTKGMTQLFEKKLEDKQASKNGASESESQRRHYFAHYSIRSYGTPAEIESGSFYKVLRGGIPPQSFSSTFYSPTGMKHSICQESKSNGHKTPYLIGIRGEYWVGTPGTFFGATRCYEQALKWYTAQCNKAGGSIASHPDTISRAVFTQTQT